jgi:hypothetical protein
MFVGSASHRVKLSSSVGYAVVSATFEKRPSGITALISADIPRIPVRTRAIVYHSASTIRRVMRPPLDWRANSTLSGDHLRAKGVAHKGSIRAGLHAAEEGLQSALACRWRAVCFSTEAGPHPQTASKY